MDSQRQNEEIKETHEKAKRWFLPLSLLFLIVFGVFLFCFKAWDTGVVIAFLPYLVLDIKKYKTISIVVQYMKGSYGRVDMGAIMACLVMAIIPVVVFYLCAQKYIIKGVAAGAVAISSTNSVFGAFTALLSGNPL